ncbi:MAG: porin, partial [Betaproteobacteria bacterium]|nr:porin [Betaproteobacteria bacterium]
FIFNRWSLHMKKSLLALAALASVASVANAQDGVQLYGVIDAGIAQSTNNSDVSSTFVTGIVPTGNEAKAKNLGTTLGMMNGGESATRWGIKGNEDLGQGRKVGFTLESGFSVANGQLAYSGLAGGSNYQSTADTSLNGQLFGRQAHLDLSDAHLGALQIGRVYNLQADIVTGGYDPVNFQMFSPINFSGFYGGGGATDNFRIDNSLKYNKKFGNYSFNLLYSLGGRSNSYTAGSSEQATVGYENSRFGLQGGYQYTHDVTSIGTPGTITNTVSSTVTTTIPTPNSVAVTYNDLRSYILAGKYNFNQKLTVKGGYEFVQYLPPSNYSSDSVITNVYNYTVASSAPGGSKQYNVYWLGADYDLSDRIKLSGGYYWVTLQAGGTAGDGYDKYASVAAEYYLSKRTNFYAAVMNDTKQGAAAAGPAYPSTFNTYGIGVRTKF